MNLDTLTIECFLAVAETGSFTKAAGKVCRSQSAVSQQIAKLEYFLDTPLFHRGKDFALTPDGEIFLGYARQISALHREALARFKEPDLDGEVRFGLPEDFASVFLSDVLAEFIRIHPRILLHVECDLTLNLYERFRNKEFDLVLVKMSRPEDFPHGLDVWSEALEWVGNPALLARDTPIALVLSPQPCVYRARAIAALEQMKRSWRIVFSSHSYAGTVAAVGAGMGITVLPRNMIPKHLPILRQNPMLPSLDDTHISLLKHAECNHSTQSLEQFVIDKLRS